MLDYTELREQLATYLNEEQLHQVAQAYQLASSAHADQRRMTGEPYVTHPLAVARILANMRMDCASILAAILHDVIEDTPLTKSQIAEAFGEEVAVLVDGVSKLTQIKFDSKQQAEAENFRKMMLAMTKDIRVILIKLADRLHNMRTIIGMPVAKRRIKAKETLEIYAPIAGRLGMSNIQVELEDLGFCALYPMRYKVLKEAVRKARGNRKEIIRTIEDALTTRLNQEKIKPYTLWGREKHLYSLYKKMKKKGRSFIEVMDVYAFRLIVNSADVCYRALGLIHAVYKPVPGRFKDYIAIPKANGYQSLHTVLLGPYGVPIEVQIRTEAMEQLAEVGIAAHWLYKDDELLRLHPHEHTHEWVQGLIDIQKSSGDSIEFIESVKLDLSPDYVYLFTPKGKIMALPQGSTPVDFAYHIHTDIGNTCVACKIDRRLAPLNTRLVSGQHVEIICAAEASPNPAWLNVVVTGKAKSKIRHWLKKQEMDQSYALGKRMLDRALHARNATLDDITPPVIKRVLKECGMTSIEALYEQIGFGQRMASVVAGQMIGQSASGASAKRSPLIIHGTEGMVVRYAKCCYPIPGDDIAGILQLGRGMIIHQESCKNAKILAQNSDNYVNVSWAPDLSEEFPVELSIDVLNERGALATLCGILSEEDSNIIGIQHHDKDTRQCLLTFVISVKNRKHLARIMRRLRYCRLVLRIARTKCI